MAEAGYAFDVVAPHPNAECGICSRESPPEMVARLAWQKAADVASRISDAMVIACDTVAECQGIILGKPQDENHARQMLTLQSGREQRVYSGLCVWPMPAGSPDVRVAVTRVRMASLLPSQLDEYLASGLWEGKAGAFGFQDRLGWLWIVEGSESNVVGLPMELLRQMLDDREKPAS